MSAETVEGRALIKENCSQTTAVWTQSQVAASSGLIAVRKAAKRNDKTKFNALLHHLTVDLLRNSYKLLKHSAMAGVDDVSWKCYGDNLESNLENIHRKIHSGSYRSRNFSSYLSGEVKFYATSGSSLFSSAAFPSASFFTGFNHTVEM
jgi:hypothetical protein